MSNRIAGAYGISIWTDPDTTDDRPAAGQFWVVLEAAGRADRFPRAHEATVTIRPLDRKVDADGPGETGERGRDRQFVALLMDHEGPFDVRVVVDGPLGRAEVDSQVDATYDLRPAPSSSPSTFSRSWRRRAMGEGAAPTPAS